MIPRRPLARHATAAGLVLLAVALPRAAGSPSSPESFSPEPPRLFTETAFPALAGRTIAVAAGGNLQSALDAARPGDVIALEPGAVFRGPFTLPDKPGTGWIVVRSADPAGRLPPPGTRIDLSHVSVMPKLEAATSPVISAAPGAHHYRLIGLEIRPAAGTFLFDLVRLAAAEGRPETTPHHVVLDRCYLHGDPLKGTRRGIALNSRFTAVVDSHLSDFKEAGADSQAICGWGGPGPFAILNNHIEGAGENLMFGGADPSVPLLVPSDIEIRRNHFVKPLSWKADEPGYAGTQWTVKNLLELKNARRVLIEGNLFENCWPQAQTGFAILFTVRNQDGGAPWSVVEDVTFVNNIVRHAGAGINILGRDTNRPSGSERTRRVRIANNLFLDIGGPKWGGNGTLFQVLEGTAGVSIEHNTAIQAGTMLMAEGEPHTGLVFRDNIALHNEYGIAGSGTGPGLPTLRAYFPGAEVTGNVIVGGDRARYPSGNAFPAALAETGFADPAGGDYSLAPSSRFKGGGSDGSDPGVNLRALHAAAAGVPEGCWRSSSSRMTRRRSGLVSRAKAGPSGSRRMSCR